MSSRSEDVREECGGKTATANATHQFGMLTGAPEAPKSAKVAMKTKNCVPPSRAADMRKSGKRGRRSAPRSTNDDRAAATHCTVSSDAERVRNEKKREAERQQTVVRRGTRQKTNLAEPGGVVATEHELRHDAEEHGREDGRVDTDREVACRREAVSKGGTWEGERSETHRGTSR